MTSTAPEFEPLGGATLARKWILEVDTSATAVPTWTPVYGRTEFQPALDTTFQDDSDYDSQGYKSQTATALGWSASFKVSRKTVEGAPAEYDPGQEAIRLAADKLGSENHLHVRWYEWSGPTGPKVEAYEGYCSASWSPDGGAMDALDTVSVTLQGKGKRIPIAHPFATP